MPRASSGRKLEAAQPLSLLRSGLNADERYFTRFESRLQALLMWDGQDDSASIRWRHVRVARSWAISGSSLCVRLLRLLNVGSYNLQR